MHHCRVEASQPSRIRALVDALCRDDTSLGPSPFPPSPAQLGGKRLGPRQGRHGSNSHDPLKNQRNNLFQLEDSGFTKEENEEYYDDYTKIMKSHVSGFSRGELKVAIRMRFFGIIVIIFNFFSKPAISKLECIAMSQSIANLLSIVFFVVVVGRGALFGEP